MADKFVPIMGGGRARGRGRGVQEQQAAPRPADSNGGRDPTRGAGGGVVVPLAPGYSDAGFVRPGVPAGGRATMQVAASTGAIPKTSDQSRGAHRGRRPISDLVVTRPTDMNTKKGSSGEAITVVANYYKILKKPEWNIYKYRVDFSPDVELLKERKKLIRKQQERLGSPQFDGTMIFSPYKFNNDPLVLVERDDQDATIQITIRFVGELLPTEGQYLHLLNLIMRNTIESLDMKRAYGPKGTKYFDPVQKIEIPEHNLQVWPGFSTSIRQHERDIMICTEVTHKVIRRDTCYQAMQKLGRDRDSIMRALIGKMIVTEYNNLTYRIDDVNFDMTPMSEFQKASGERISFLQYFRDRYNVNIRDTRQPLLVSRAKARDIRAGRPEIINLIPELCRFTGLDDDMRANFRLMRDMAQSTRLNPESRVKRFVELNRRIQQEQKAQEVMKKWEMSLDRQLVEFPARVLDREAIVFGAGKAEQPNNEADWTFALKKNALFQSESLTNWHVVTPMREMNLTNKFLSLLTSCAQRARFNMQRPQIISIPDDRSTSYVNAIEQACNDSTQIVMCVVPNQRADRYSAIKKISCVDRAVPTQCMWTKVMGNDKIIGGVAVKVMIQMSCKLGNAPWTVKIPAKRIMTVGFDVTFDPNDKSKSFGAFVATMDLSSTNTYYSAVSQHKHGEEMSNFLILNVMKALKQYISIHKELPTRIIFYRDGVGEGDINHVLEYEVKKLREDLKRMYRDQTPKLTFIIVSKRINTRVFKKLNGTQILNAPPGTVVDDVITLPERYDFFLVSQSTRQGTISPTSYNVVFDESGLPPDRMQIWTYKMTHLYYNWSGNVKVPAVCQYAQKLALLVGQHIRREPSHLLEKQLYFL